MLSLRICVYVCVVFFFWGYMIMCIGVSVYEIKIIKTISIELQLIPKDNAHLVHFDISIIDWQSPPV